MKEFFNSNLFSKIMRLFYSIALAYFLYWLTFNIIDQNYLLFPHSSRQKFNFYSGNKEGCYYDIGAKLKNYNSLLYNNIPTNGSVENKIKLSRDAHAFGMIGENMYDQKNEEKFDLVCEMYEEKLHIIYKTNSFLNLNRVIELKKTGNETEIINFIMNSKINIGQPNSQVSEISKNIIKIIIPNAHKDSTQLFNYTLEESLDSLEQGNIQILFFMSGYADRFERLLKNEEYGLMTIELALFDELKRRYASLFTYSDFEDSPYDPIFNQNKTLSLKAFLVSSKNTPYIDKITILENIEKLKPVIKTLSNKEILSSFKKDNSQYQNKIYVFLVLISIFMIIAFQLILLVSSEYNKTKYFNSINNNAISKIPKNYDDLIDKDSDRYYIYPKIDSNQVKIVNQTIKGIAFIAKTRENISNKYDKGWLKSYHYNFLINKCDDIIGKLRKTLAIRLNEIIEREDGLQNYLSHDYLRKYLTADWLNQKDYEWILSKMEKKEVLSISKVLLRDMLGNGLVNEVIKLLINFFKTKEEKFVTEKDKELYKIIILISSDYYSSLKLKGKYNDDFNKIQDSVKYRILEFIDKLEDEKLLD